MRFGIGQPVTRKEDPRFLTGRGHYVADIDLARQAHAVFIYSAHAHALIRSVDKTAAEQMPGVLAVFTGEDWAADGLGTLDPEITRRFPRSCTRRTRSAPTHRWST